MKNWSIRTRILAGVVLVNLVGMIVVAVYLHQAFAGAVEDTAAEVQARNVAAWEQVVAIAANEFGDPSDPAAAAKYTAVMKAITGDDYAVLIDKSTADEAKYAEMREAAGLPNNWDEGGETYVVTSITDEALAADMLFEASPDTVDDIGKVVGVENGACSRMCHEAITGTGDYWKVRWSKDDKSRAHTVFPASSADGKISGVVYSIHDVSKAADAARDAQVRTTLVIVAGLAIATALIALMLNSLIFTRLKKMITSMEDISVRVAGGDFDAHFEPDGTTDEIGQFEQFFAQFMDLVSGTLKSLVK